MAVDPGTHKCGVAVVDSQGLVFTKKIVSRDELVIQAKELIQEYQISLIVVGDRTHSKAVREQLAVLGIPLKTVNENQSSMEGRYRYVKENTKGLARLLPIGLRTPDRPYDDYVAVVLAERYLQGKGSEKNQ